MKFTKEMESVFPDGKITEAQMEILEMFSLKLTNQEMDELKETLSMFLVRRADKMVDKMKQEGKYPSMKDLKKIHIRTPYKMA